MEICQHCNLSGILFQNFRGIVDCHVKIGSARSSYKGQVHVECVSYIADMLVKTIEDLSSGLFAFCLFGSWNVGKNVLRNARILFFPTSFSRNKHNFLRM
jgi:hypothetical protein